MNKNKKEEEKAKGLLSAVAFFNALNKYIPSLVLQNWMDVQKQELLEAEQAKM